MKKIIFLFSFVTTLLCCTKDNIIDTDTQPTPTIMPILPFSTFSLGGSDKYFFNSYLPIPPNNNYWEIAGGSANSGYAAAVYVFLPDTSATTTSKVYTLQDNYNTLTSGKACIIMTWFKEDIGSGPGPLHSITSTVGGKLRVTPIPLNSSNSYGGFFKINFIFNDVEAKEDSTGSIYHLSGNFATY